MDEIKISSLNEYIQIVENLSPVYSLSRGQEYDNDLLPTILRKDDNGMNLYTKSDAQSFIDDFKCNSPLYIENSMIQNHNELLVFAQHFGVPTHLLDFTYSHLVSLMFAVENAFTYIDDDKNSVVWFLNPAQLNLYSIHRTDLFDLSTEEKLPSNTEFPIAVSARKNNKRIAAQNGLFVYFQPNGAPLNRLSISDTILYKVIIPHNVGRKILKSLFMMGMRFNDLYPELSSVAKDIMLKNNVNEYYKMEEEND